MKYATIATVSSTTTLSATRSGIMDFAGVFDAPAAPPEAGAKGAGGGGGTATRLRMRVNSLCMPTSRELPSAGGSADAPHTGGGATGGRGVPFTLGAGDASEKLGAGGTTNAGTAPSEGGPLGSSDSGGGELGVVPNDGRGSGAGDDRYGSENGARGRSAAGVVSIGRGISGARNGAAGAEPSDGTFEPAAGEIR